MSSRRHEGSRYRCFHPVGITEPVGALGIEGGCERADGLLVEHLPTRDGCDACDAFSHMY